MKGKALKIISLFLCTILIAVGAVYSVALNDNGKTSENKPADITEKVPASTVPESVFKDETVYVIADANGTVQKIIVSDWLKNALSADKINDVTELENVENIKGDEEYTTGGNNVIVWDANGKDIYYQGITEKELPVNLTVSYNLDGQAISPDELAGKSGKVTIRFDYRNNQYETVKINHKDEKIYVPFAVFTGMILDNDNFSNVEVSNGKVINDGDRTIVIGFAFPGLQEDLGIDRNKFEIPSYVEITADASDFSLGMTVTVASNALFNSIDTEKINSVYDLTGSITELNNAMAQLLDGSSALYDGICTLLEKSGELVSGINQLADGASKLKDGANDLNSGAEQLYNGTAALLQGLDTLAANNDKLNDGAKKVFETFLATAEAQLKEAGFSVPALTIDNYASVLNEILDSLDETKLYNQALEQVTAAVEENRDYIKSQVTNAVREQVEAGVTSAVKEQVTAQVTETVKNQVLTQVTEAVRKNVEEQVILAATGMDKAKYDAAVSAGRIDTATQNMIESAVNEKMAGGDIKALISKNTDEQMQSSNIQSLIAQKVSEQMETEQVKNIITANINSKMAENEIQALIEEKTEEQIQKIVAEKMAGEEVQSKLAAAAEGVKSIKSLKSSLDDYNTFYLGLRNYTSGVAQAASGASELSKGASDLKNGTKVLYNGAVALYDGVNAMKNSVPALTDGITRLKDGAMQLSEGLSQFNEKGIQKLADSVDDAETFTERLKATVKVSKNYRAFAGISNWMDGNVKFIYKTAEIKDK